MQSIKFFENGVIVTLNSGERIVSCPEDNENYRKTASELGYDNNVLAMCQDHDPLHILLCDFFGIKSHALHSAIGDSHDPYLANLEENAVLAVQKWLRACGVSAESLFVHIRR